MAGIVLKIGGQPFTTWTRCELTRDLGDISGSFQFDYNDTARVAKLLPKFNAAPLVQAAALEPGPAITVAIDGELVLKGYAVDVHVEADPDRITASAFGLDATGDLVECSANPEGPMEYLGLDLTGIVSRLVQPFGMTARAETDVGDAFPHFSIDVGETVMSAIEKAARQRGVLVTSDGVGGIVLTESGHGRAPLQAAEFWRRTGRKPRATSTAPGVRMSSAAGGSPTTVIKGQLPHVRSARATGAPASSMRRSMQSTAPLGAGRARSRRPPAEAPTTSRPRKSCHAGRGKHGPVYQTGHATDAGVAALPPQGVDDAGGGRAGHGGRPGRLARPADRGAGGQHAPTPWSATRAGPTRPRCGCRTRWWR